MNILASAWSRLCELLGQVIAVVCNSCGINAVDAFHSESSWTRQPDGGYTLVTKALSSVIILHWEHFELHSQLLSVSHILCGIVQFQGFLFVIDAHDLPDSFIAICGEIFVKLSMQWLYQIAQYLCVHIFENFGLPRLLFLLLLSYKLKLVQV